MSNPRISVVIPTCHRNDLLIKCLDCLAPGAQTLPASEYEVIVSDDGFSHTAQQMMSEKYPWARWAQGPRRGPAANRNCGAREARGEYVAFTDDDCLPTPQWLQSYANAIRDSEGIYEGATNATAPLRAPFIIAPINLTGGMLWSCNMMVNHQLFDELGGFDEGFPHAADEDTDFRERVKAAGHTLHFVAEALIYHPPVRRVWGRKSARLWQSKVRLGYKMNPQRPRFTRRDMVWHALRTRGHQIWRAPLHFDKFLSIGALLVELIWIARYAPGWDRKQRQSLNTVGKPLSAPEIENSSKL